MSKSKSKSKSKQATFPNQSWQPDFAIYTYYPALFDHGKELLDAPVQKPPQGGDVIAEEVQGMLKRQQYINEHFDERERRLEEINWEISNLSRRYQTALLTGPDTYSKTWQLMNTMCDVALVPVMHFKKEFARPRPNQIELRIEPLIEVPGHPSYPSGHATENFLVAHFLSEVIGDDAELIARVFAIARRVAENREYAGVHYPSDTEAGEELARDIFQTMKRVFEEPIKEAIKEWQELELEDERGAPAAMAEKRDDPFPGTHFRDHQWNLENVGPDGKHGVDINVLGAWKELKIWQEAPAAVLGEGELQAEQRKDAGGPKDPIRVALIDLAVDFDHPALAGRFDEAAARNLDYPNITKENRERYLEAFRSFSSAHAIACAGIIAADAKQVADKPGCLGIAPHCQIIPYRAMTLTEPVRHKRQMLARGVLEAATGVSFKKTGRRSPRWTVGDEKVRPAHILLFPLPAEPLPDDDQDPLALALAFAATKIPVIIPSGNRGTSNLSYLSVPGRHFKDPTSFDELSELFDLDRNGGHAVFGADGRILENLLYSIRNEAAAICVGACNDQGRRSRYSQYGDGLTVVAPSDDILPSPQEIKAGARRPQSIATTDLKGIGGYMQDQSNYTLSNNEFGFGGTSAAGAQVAGVVALMLQANQKLAPKEVRDILCETARVEPLVLDNGAPPAKPSDEFGYGLIDATGCVQEAQHRP